MSETAMRETNITEYVDDYRNLEISYDAMHFLEALDVSEPGQTKDFIVIPYDSLTSKYKTDLEELVTTKTFTAEEQSRYFFNPWNLSFDLYGSVEYWHLLLELNSMYSINEFNQETIKVYNGSLPTLVEKIIAIEEEFITENSVSVEATISGNVDYSSSTEKLDNDVNYVEII